jgi:cell division protein FtsN
MARDYKNAKRRSSSSGLSGLAGFVVGLALGLSVALGVYLFDRRPAARMARQEQQSAPMSRDEKSAAAKPEPAAADADAETQFDFYEMLPKFEVVVPQGGSGARGGSTQQPSGKPGTFILQAGSFRNPADADRRRALIALRGVESRIQKVTIDKDTWHRVLIGPVSGRQKLEDTQSKLRQEGIDPLTIRVGE